MYIILVCDMFLFTRPHQTKPYHCMQVSEEQSLEREEKLQKQIRELMSKLKIADTRSENAEMDIGRLNVRIDKVEEDLVIEKSKIKSVSDELNGVFDDMMYV